MQKKKIQIHFITFPQRDAVTGGSFCRSVNSARTALTPAPLRVTRRLRADKSAIRARRVSIISPCAPTQKRLLLEDILVDKREQRRARSVVVVVLIAGRAVSGFALQRWETRSNPRRLCASGRLAHLQRDPVVLARRESVDVIVPELLHHGRQLPVALDHRGAAPAALLVLQ